MDSHIVPPRLLPQKIEHIKSIHKQLFPNPPKPPRPPKFGLLIIALASAIIINKKLQDN